MGEDATGAALIQAKAQMRARLFDLRATVADGTDAAQRACARLGDVLGDMFGPGRDSQLGQCVMSGYIPIRGELDPLPAMTAHPGPVAVPVIRAKGHALEFHRWTPGCAMVQGTFKTMIPQQHDPLVPQVLIVPLLAFDLQGFRLGYGGGYYDRTLEQLRASGPVLAIGFAHDIQQVAKVPIEATDQRLDLIVTPDRVVRPV